MRPPEPCGFVDPLHRLDGLGQHQPGDFIHQPELDGKPFVMVGTGSVWTKLCVADQASPLPSLLLARTRQKTVAPTG